MLKRKKKDEVRYLHQRKDVTRHCEYIAKMQEKESDHSHITERALKIKKKFFEKKKRRDNHLKGRSARYLKIACICHKNKEK